MYLFRKLSQWRRSGAILEEDVLVLWFLLCFSFPTPNYGGGMRLSSNCKHMHQHTRQRASPDAQESLERRPPFCSHRWGDRRNCSWSAVEFTLFFSPLLSTASPSSQLTFLQLSPPLQDFLSEAGMVMEVLLNSDMVSTSVTRQQKLALAMAVQNCGA